MNKSIRYVIKTLLVIMIISCSCSEPQGKEGEEQTTLRRLEYTIPPPDFVSEPDVSHPADEGSSVESRPEPELTISAVELQNRMENQPSEWINRRIAVTGIVFDRPSEVSLDGQSYLALWTIPLPRVVRDNPGTWEYTTEGYEFVFSPLVYCHFDDARIEQEINDTLRRDIDEVRVVGTVVRVKEIRDVGGVIKNPILDHCILLPADNGD